MESKLKIQICSDIDYNNLIAEIYFDEKFVALISQEDGVSNLKLEFPGLNQNEEAVIRKVDLDWFQEALLVAKKSLVGDVAPHGHGHAPGTGTGIKGQGKSLDINGYVVPSKSPAAHWPIK